MKSALIFLNGHYDLRYPQFYREVLTWAVENRHPLICADGGLRLFTELNQISDSPIFPNALIGDLDSLDELPEGTIEQLERSGTRIVREWIGQVDKDDTDGQLAISYAIAEYDCQRVLLYGGLPRPNSYDIDHFLGNLRLMRFGLQLFQDSPNGNKRNWLAEMRDPLQTTHFVVSHVTLERKNVGLQRVSLISDRPQRHCRKQQKPSMEFGRVACRSNKNKHPTERVCVRGTDQAINLPRGRIGSGLCYP